MQVEANESKIRGVIVAVPTRIIDGDTFVARVDHLFRVYSIQRFRLYGIDCPEHDEVSTKYLADTILNRVVQIESIKEDSFGRWLCVVKLQGEPKSLNELMIEKGYAVPWTKK